MCLLSYKSHLMLIREEESYKISWGVMEGLEDKINMEEDSLFKEGC